MYARTYSNFMENITLMYQTFYLQEMLYSESTF